MSKYTVFNPTPFESHSIVLNKIESHSKVLDLGCATGYFDGKLKQKECIITGIDIDPRAIKNASIFCKNVYAIDLEKIDALPFPKKSFDYILMLDLIEHIRNPDKLLSITKSYLRDGGEIIISTPNVAFISLRLSHLRGKFEYTKVGLMDETHVKFFTNSTLRKLINNSGMKVTEMDYSSGFSQITFVGKYLNIIPKYWQYKITKLFPTLLGYQLIATCKVNTI